MPTMESRAGCEADKANSHKQIFVEFKRQYGSPCGFSLACFDMEVKAIFNTPLEFSLCKDFERNYRLGF